MKKTLLLLSVLIPMFFVSCGTSTQNEPTEDIEPPMCGHTYKLETFTAYYTFYNNGECMYDVIYENEKKDTLFLNYSYNKADSTIYIRQKYQKIDDYMVSGDYHGNYILFHDVEELTYRMIK